MGDTAGGMLSVCPIIINTDCLVLVLGKLASLAGGNTCSRDDIAVTRCFTMNRYLRWAEEGRDERERRREWRAEPLSCRHLGGEKGIHRNSFVDSVTLRKKTDKNSAKSHFFQKRAPQTGGASG